MYLGYTYCMGIHRDTYSICIVEKMIETRYLAILCEVQKFYARM